MKMKWYGAKLLFRAEDEKGKLCCGEESVRLIQARGWKEAEKRAKKVGKDEETEYTTMTGGYRKWIFEEVLDIFEMFEAPKHGEEVYSAIIVPKEVKVFRKMYGDEEITKNNDKLGKEIPSI